MVAHGLRIVFKFPIEQMPILIHTVLVVLAGYAGLGYILHFKKVDFANFLDKFIYILILLHLSTTAIMHLYSIIFKTNKWITVFPFWYSYLAIGYFALFAFYSFKLKSRI